MYYIFFVKCIDPKGHVSYCHHLVSVVVVGRKLFQKSSPLKVLDQWKPNLVRIITRVSSFKIVSGDAVHQPTCKGAKNTKIKCITYFLLSVFWQFHYKTNDFDGYLS
jgi:hypothetical protein